MSFKPAEVVSLYKILPVQDMGDVFEKHLTVIHTLRKLFTSMHKQLDKTRGSHCDMQYPYWWATQRPREVLHWSALCYRLYCTLAILMSYEHTGLCGTIDGKSVRDFVWRWEPDMLMYCAHFPGKTYDFVGVAKCDSNHCVCTIIE